MIECIRLQQASCLGHAPRYSLDRPLKIDPTYLTPIFVDNPIILDPIFLSIFFEFFKRRINRVRVAQGLVEHLLNTHELKKLQKSVFWPISSRFWVS